MASFEVNDVVFSSSVLGPGELFVRRMRGREGISRLSAFELYLETTFEGALEFDQIDEMLAGTAYLAFGSAEEHKIHGVLSAVEMVSMGAPSPVVYRATLVPRMWYTTQTFRSRVYQDMSVPDILKQIFRETGMTEGEHYELHLTAPHPKREYTVQYQETDFAFISRLMEYEGIFYFFEHGDAGDKAVVADSNNAFVFLDGRATFSYNPRGGMTDPQESVTSLERRVQVVPKSVTLRDYNYRTPALRLLGEADADPQAGKGTQLYYGEHVKDMDDARRVARVRAQEIFARKETYTGRSAVRGLRAGHRFGLTDHFLSALDQEYVITGMTHSVSQEAVGSGGTMGYSNEFEATPYDVPFRPERTTPKPRIFGLMHAKVDGAMPGTAAPIDTGGRYKVLLPLDSAAKAGGRATRWIRMAQPHAGAGYGMHFPLHIGIEVVIAHLDGDPDRPVIVGSVPNPETTSPVTDTNATQSVIRTRAGIHMEFEDDA